MPNGNRLGRLRPSGPIGIRARTMTPRLSRSACSPSIAGCALYIIRKASPSSCSAPESSRGQYVMPAAISHCSNRQLREFALGRIDRIFAALAGIEPRDQRADHRRPCSPAPRFHSGMSIGMPRRLNAGDGLGAVFAPAHHALRDRSERNGDSPRVDAAAVQPNCGRLPRNSRTLPVGRIRASGPRRSPWPFPACRSVSQPSMP